MAVTQIRGDSQLQNNTLTNDSLTSRTNILTLATVSNGDVKFSPNGTGQIDANSHKIKNLTDPTSPQDAATKFYADSLSAGLDPKASCRVGTVLSAGDIPGYATSPSNGRFTIPNGNSTFFPNAGAAVVIDGVTLVNGDRVLVKDQSDAKQNGIYSVTNAGVQGTTDAVITRSSDMDGTPANEVSGGNFTFVETGTEAGTGWVVLWDGIITLNTNPVNWTQFSTTGAAAGNSGDVQYSDGAGHFQASDNLTFTPTPNCVLTLQGTGASEVDLTLAHNGNKAINFTSLDFSTTNGTIYADASDLHIIANSGNLFVTADGSMWTFEADGSLLFPNLSSDPSGVEGEVIYNSTVHELKYYNGTSWVAPISESNFVTREVPSGTINGSNVTFTLASTPFAGSEEVFLNGLLQNVGGGNDYTISGGTITFNSAPQTNSVLLVSYRK